jgi:putative flippase GtrA
MSGGIVRVYLLHGYAFISSGLGYLFGSIVNYYLNHVVTFGKDRSQRKHLVAVSRFYIANGISWSINTALMGLLVDMAGYNTWFSQIFATGVCLFWNYFAARFWVYKT